MTRPRSLGDIRRHGPSGSKAARAVFTARSTSSDEPRGTLASTSPDDGS